MSFCYMNINKHLSCWWAQTRSDPESNSAPGPKEEEVQLRTCEQRFKTGLTTTTTTSHIIQTNNQHKSKKQDMQRLNQRLNESSSQAHKHKICQQLSSSVDPFSTNNTHTQSIFPFDFAMRLFEPSLPFFWINNFFVVFLQFFCGKTSTCSQTVEVFILSLSHSNSTNALKRDNSSWPLPEQSNRLTWSQQQLIPDDDDNKSNKICVSFVHSFFQTKPMPKK